MSVISQATARTNADTIKNETAANANTATRIGQLFRDLADSLAWVAFVGSGASHAGGLVPDPGSVAGNSRYLCEDGTWRAPSSAVAAPTNGADDGKVAYANAGNLNYTAALKVLANGAIALAMAAATGTVLPVLSVTDAAHTALAASTERHAVLFDLSSTKQWATGTLATQRSMRVRAPTLAFVAASTANLAATVSIEGPPIAGANATITKALALWLESGGVGFGTGAMPAAGLLRFGYVNVAGGGVPMMRAFLEDGTTEVSLALWNAALNLFELGTNSGAGVRLKGSSTGTHVLALNNVDKLAVSATQLDLKTLFALMSTQSAPSAPTSTDVRFFNEGGILKTRNATRIVSLDFPTIFKGTDLTDANETLSPTKGTRYVQPPILTANRTKTLSTSGSPAQSDTMVIENEDDTYSLTIANGGPSGGNVYASVPPNTMVFAQFDGANYVPVGRYGIL